MLLRSLLCFVQNRLFYVNQNGIPGLVIAQYTTVCDCFYKHFDSISVITQKQEKHKYECQTIIYIYINISRGDDGGGSG